MNPVKSIYDNSKKLSNIEIIANPDDKEMQSLISNAHINLLLTDQATGLKLKLLNSLFQGKFCLVNSNMLVGTGLDRCVETADTKDEIFNKINHLMQQEFTLELFQERRSLIPQEYNNDYKTKKLIDLIFN